MRMRLVRDNDDPKLLADLERLAGREPAPLPVGEAAGEVADDAAAEEAADPTPLDDPFVRGFVQATVHVKRYAPFYAGAIAWAATMLLIQPLGGDDEGAGPTAFAGTASRSASASPVASVAPTRDLNADAIGAPTFETMTGASFAPSESFTPSSDLAFDDSSSSASSDESSSSGGSSTAGESPTFDFDDTDADSDSTDGLTIVRSGYASATGGTPANQDPPGGGLPVAVTLGNDTKRSFVELAGTGTELRLRQSPNGALQPGSAVIKACPLTSDWKAERGQPIRNSPTFESACSTGSLSDGIWSFDLSGFSADVLARGLTLTPGPGTAHTFEVVLEPTPLPPASASGA